MEVSEIGIRIIAVVSAYLIGSIPFAYITTRLTTGKDIRLLGSGNGGANNVFHEVGWKAAIPVGILDVSKGAVAVIVASRLLDISPREPNIFVLFAALAAIAGHIWPVYLKLRGGHGLSPTIGTLIVIMPWELLIAIALLLVFVIFTHNFVLSTNLGLLSVPISAWFIDASWVFVGFSLIAGLMMAVHFVPKARSAAHKAGGKKGLTSELLRKNKG